MKPGQAFEQSILDSLPRWRNPESGKLERHPLIFFRKNPTPPRPAPVRELVAECRMLRAAVEGAYGKICDVLAAEALRITALGADGVTLPEWARELNAQRSALGALLAPGEPDWIGRADKFGSSFTPGAGVDLFVSAPAVGSNLGRINGLPVHLVYGEGGAARMAECRPLIDFSLECKSVDAPRIPFSALRPEQGRILRQARSAGHVAGLLVEFRGVEPRECWLVLVDAWDAAQAASDRQSLPIAQAREIGVRLEIDPARGTVATYWRMGDFIRHFGGEV